MAAVLENLRWMETRVDGLPSTPTATGAGSVRCICSFFRFLDGADSIGIQSGASPSMSFATFPKVLTRSRRKAQALPAGCPLVARSQPVSDLVPALGTGTVVQRPLPQGGGHNVTRWATLIWQEPWLFSQQTTAAIAENY